MNILVFAPHADDEVLGCGGTIAKHINSGDKVFVCIATRPKAPIFKDELFDIIRSETIASHKFLKIEKTFFLELPAVMVEEVPRHQINSKISAVIDEVKPDIVYMPHFGDMQKDHTLVAEAIMVAVRPKNTHKVKTVLSYETLSETEWNMPHSANMFIPNVYNDISEFLEIKKEAMSYFKSQLDEFPNPRSLEAVEALAKYRGSTILANAAESFMLVRDIK
ncbi:MAG: PIG-L deacetylase family protein [Oscillospiraceae bacterium]